MLTFLLLITVLFSNAQRRLNPKDFYGMWELRAVNSVVLEDLKNENVIQFIASTYFQFKKKNYYNFYRDGITTKGTFQVEFSSSGTNTLILIDDNGESHRFLVTYKKRKLERVMLLVENKKRIGSAEDKKIVTDFIKIKKVDLIEFRKKVEKEKKFLIEKKQD